MFHHEDTKDTKKSLDRIYRIDGMIQGNVGSFSGRLSSILFILLILSNSFCSSCSLWLGGYQLFPLRLCV
jgi:hypothetical protein